MIRIFDVRGKLLKVIEGSNDVVRALCRVSSNTADFASAGNDGIIHLWTRDGKRTAQLHGHENFIYSLASFSNGEFVSSGEDRTVRLWRDGICIQTITHPAISVWTVAACDANGDIVSGASDRVVRVFSRAEERQAAADDIKAFQDSVKSSSIPQQQLGGINKEKLPGPAFLQQKSGTKEGQVQIIQEPNGNISAHQWSQATQSWTNVGTVVDAAGSSGRKQTYLGQDYDYVFDVDIEDGKPPLKLPYNVSQNPYEAATKFIQDNELPISYLDQVAAFITQNTQGATLGQQEPASSDAWGTEARYRPDGSTEPPTAQQQPSQRPKVLPQKTYLAIKTADLRTILKKISEFNQKLVQEGSKHDSLGDDLIKILEDARKPLEEALSRGPTKDSTLSDVVPITIHMIEVWPAGFRLPALDLLRLLAAASPALAEYVSSPCVTILETLERYAFDDNERANNVMLGVRTLGNLFETEAGRAIADSHFDKVRLIAKDCADQQSSAPNRNTLNALATLYLNYAVLFTSNQTGPSSSSTGQKRLTVFNDVVAFLKQTSDSEAVYRGLVAAGTILSVGGLEANLVSQIRNTCSEITKKNKETRVQNVCSEIREYAAKQT